MRQNIIQQSNCSDNNVTKRDSGHELELRETCVYVADMLLELRNLAKSNGQKTLQGLIELAYYEAYSVAHRAAIPDGEREYIHQLGSRRAPCRRCRLTDRAKDEIRCEAVILAPPAGIATFHLEPSIN